MNTKTFFKLLSVLTLLTTSPLGHAQTTAFTYQGKLVDDCCPATGLYDLAFKVYDAVSAGTAMGDTVIRTAAPVTNGLFTVTLDFGSGVFTGAGRWLEISVRTNGSPMEHVLLSPRQALTPAPYAIYAASAGTAANLQGTYGGAVVFNNAANSFQGSFAGNGGGLNSVNAATLDGLPAASFWRLGGNTATVPGTHFLGTTDYRALELKVNGTRALRLEPGAVGTVNVIGGFPFNHVDSGVSGATIAGGGFFSGSFIESNSVAANGGTIGGGGRNTILANAFQATIGGGLGHRILENSFQATISGGSQNIVVFDSPFATVGGGVFNGIYTQSPGGVIGGGAYNAIGQGADYAAVSGGTDNTVWSDFGSVGGGVSNFIHVASSAATIAGGEQNTIEPDSAGATIGGGCNNLVESSAFGAVIPGGLANTASGACSFAAGFRAEARHSGAFVWADRSSAGFSSTAANEFSVRATGGARVVTAINNSTGTPLAGVQLAPGSGTWSSLSDRAAKDHVTVVDGRDVLKRLASVPIATWNYRTQDDAIRHIGPMAQDFKAAFGVGENDTTITTVDADGVSLAAIQGLHHIVQEKEGEIRELKEAMMELKELVNTLRRERGGGR